MTCPHCHRLIPARLLRKEGARALSAKRKIHGGAPKKLSKCKGCGAKLGVREMAAHKCEGKP